MSTRDISDTIKDIYGVEVSAAMISKITDKIIPKDYYVCNSLVFFINRRPISYFTKYIDEKCSKRKILSY